jgi:ribosomal-protein-alanine N-acetyltransferase
MITIVDGSADDIDGVVAVMDSAFDPAFGEAWTKSQLRSSLAMSGTRLAVAKYNNETAGFALVRTIAGETELLMIGVHRLYQKKSIASKLIAKVIEYSIKEHSFIVFLEVRDGNSAHKFYEKIGFLEIGRRTNYYTGSDGKRFDAITMRLNQI